jgi:hypothetical protein
MQAKGRGHHRRAYRSRQERDGPKANSLSSK